MYTLQLSELNLLDIDKVGGKNASLGELIRNMNSLGINVPGGFAITVDAYKKFLDHNDLKDKIMSLLSSLDANDVIALRKSGNKVRELIRQGEMPKDVADEVVYMYNSIPKKSDQFLCDVAVRSSATAEDLPDASFAGQQETFLNVRGQNSVLDAVRNCFASLFTNRAISYRSSRNYSHFDVSLAVCVQEMVRSDLSSSGVAFSIDTESGFKDSVIINASYGLGEMLVQGHLIPDEFLIFKPTLKEGFSSIIEKKMGTKSRKMIYGTKPGENTRIINVLPKMRRNFCIDDDIALKIANWVTKIEEYYSELNGRWCPVDVEWAIDGLTKEVYIVQARPETIHSQKKQNVLVEHIINDVNRDEKIIVKGVAVGDNISSGKIKVMSSLDSRDGSEGIEQFDEGDVLVTEMTDPDWEPIMKKASAIITNKGGRTCHAAIVAREMGLPAIVGAKSINKASATETLKTGNVVTVSCAEGDIGKVYTGVIDFHEIETNLDNLPTTKTPLMLNVASPDLAFKFSSLPSSGVGLAREEFIINNYIGVHPMALLRHSELNDEVLTNTIEDITSGYEDEQTFFVKKLSYGIAKIGAAFYPNEVIVRFSDFKSNEYRNLLGGKYFEPEEENPMIGWRGCSRYYSDSFKEAFGMECKAIKRVREKMGLKNVSVMLPFCRTPNELLKVYEVMKEYGIERGKNGLKVIVMAELPSNIILAREFSKHVDGFSIGSNDLTQLVLGLDRDSELVQHLYDERNDAVKSMISYLIGVCKETNTKVGICGQGPSDYPDFAQFLVKEGIDTISITPDSMLKTLKSINKIEQSL